MEAKTYIAKEKETVTVFKLKEETYDELIKTLLDNGVPFTFGEGCDNPFVELPACGGGTEVAVIGDYIAPFGSCFRVYKKAFFEDRFELKSKAKEV